MTITRVPIVTKTAKVVQALSEGRDIDALRIANGFRMLTDEQKTTIQRGWSAYQNPAMYRSMGRDPTPEVNMVALRADSETGLELAEERAAIMEYDGRLSREDAEAYAFQILREAVS